jgi:hypothetical protein
VEGALPSFFNSHILLVTPPKRESTKGNSGTHLWDNPVQVVLCSIQIQGDKKKGSKLKMPSIIIIGKITINTAQTSGGVYVGENIIAGMDANSKNNTAQGGTYGFFNIVKRNVNFNSDNFEVADGNIKSGNKAVT